MISRNLCSTYLCWTVHPLSMRQLKYLKALFGQVSAIVWPDSANPFAYFG